MRHPRHSTLSCLLAVKRASDQNAPPEELADIAATVAESGAAHQITVKTSDKTAFELRNEADAVSRTKPAVRHQSKLEEFWSGSGEY